MTQPRGKGINPFVSDDLGAEGWYNPVVLVGHPLNELRNVAGQPPHPNKKWVMVNLFDGEVKWYQSRRRRSRK